MAVLVDEAMRDCIAAYVESLRAAMGPAARHVRWVDPAQYHFTLRFLGDLDEQARQRVFDAAGEACSAARRFRLSTGAVGAFPSLERPRVLWIGVEPPEAARRLVELAAHLEQALVARGLGPADKPFSAHLTLGRLRDGAPGQGVAAALGERRPPAACGSMVVREVTVMASTLTARGPIHTPLFSAPIRAGRDE
ncbi:RNA 2',3'-cyclic phosphodiesterase [Carboxydochorda subterranea]|uniref:RNA 2',3'-cyclic phosphodiesterase n=1 Tax=Carboxydichorda subterranea TaxID=3109565 RepID=A0ABZ1C0H7_9FIRM|nr:RNA 2',3'-cyclic phosphodiesterase [Limnochorda sp. L945t]WRP18582.1 RNA 2',3'-cyclic phosphodiesterase [Limnochorda sp. L945t]